MLDVYAQCRLAWACWAVARGPQANLCMLCMAWFLMFEHLFCWTYQYNKYVEFYQHLQFYSCEWLCRYGP